MSESDIEARVIADQERADLKAEEIRAHTNGKGLSIPQQARTMLIAERVLPWTHIREQLPDLGVLVLLAKGTPLAPYIDTNIKLVSRVEWGAQSWLWQRHDVDDQEPWHEDWKGYCWWFPLRALAALPDQKTDKE